jgi:hypothetical protein
MGQDFEALGRYTAGKKELSNLLEIRSKTLQSLDEFNFVKLWDEMKNPETVALLDVKGFETTLHQLSKLEEQIRSLVEAINLNAEKSDSPKIEYKKVDPKLF